MELNKENYYSVEYEALLKVKGEIVEEPSKAMLVGSYVDAYFSGELEQFKINNPQIFKKDGTLLKDFEQANEIISAIEQDELMMKYLNGKKQVIMTGEIGGVKYKIKIDCLKEDCIVDQKVMSSYKDLIWVEKDGRNVKVDFVEAYGYDIQGAIYQEIVRQNIGKKLPFILAVATKEDGVDKALIQIDQEYLDQALSLVTQVSERYDLIKQGIVEPRHCEKCASCRKAHKVERVVSYQELFNKGEENGENN